MRTRLFLPFAFAIGLVAFGTSLSFAQVAPTLASPASNNVTTVAANLGAEVTADGGSAITARGVVIAPAGINPDPQLDGGTVMNLVVGGTTGVLSVNATALTPNTYYAFRAYATNAVGTVYTDVATFRTGLEVSTGFSGNGVPISTVQPTIAMSWMICTGGVFPSRGGSPEWGDDAPYLGEIRLMAFDSANEISNWKRCDGQIMPIRSYTALFSLLGTFYGGDGVNTFALPDLRGRIPIGFGQGPGLSDYELGERVGVENVSVLQNNLPSHNHTVAGGNTESVGSGQPLENRQPSLALNICVQTGEPEESSGLPQSLGWIRIFGFNFTPGGCLPCDGSVLDSALYPRLFAKLGTTFGGNGTTFALPDLRGRALMGTGLSGDDRAPRALGEKGGTEMVSLLSTHIAAHQHAYAGGFTGIAGISEAVTTVQPFVALQPAVATVRSLNGDDEYNGDYLPFVAEVRFWATTSLAPIWLPCDGRTLSISEYNALFDWIGTTYQGDGQTDFLIPDLRDRVVVVSDTVNGFGILPVGLTGGAMMSLLRSPISRHINTRPCLLRQSAPASFRISLRRPRRSGAMSRRVAARRSLKGELCGRRASTRRRQTIKFRSVAGPAFSAIR